MNISGVGAMSIGGLIKQSFELYQRNLWPFLIIYFPVSFISFIIEIIGEVDSPTPLVLISIGILTLIDTILAIFAQGAVVNMAKEATEKKITSIDRGIDVVLRRWADLLVASILMAGIILIGILLLVIPGLIAAFFLLFTTQALIVDDLRPLEALRQSYKFVREHITDTIALAIVLLMIVIAVGLLIGIFAQVSLLGPLLSLVVTLLVGPFMIILLTVTYIGIEESI